MQNAALFLLMPSYEDVGTGESTALQSRCVSSHRTLDNLPFVFGTLGTLEQRAVREGLAGCLPIHPPTPTGQLQPAIAYSSRSPTRSSNR